MSLKQNTNEVQDIEDADTYEEIRSQSVGGLIEMFGAAFSDLTASNQDEVKRELELEFKAHGHLLDEIASTFEKEGNLGFYLERIETKKKVIASAPQDLRGNLQAVCVTGVLSLNNLLNDGKGWGLYRKHLEYEAEKNKTGTTWQELPFIRYIRNWFSDIEIESVLTHNGRLMNVWGDMFCLGFDPAKKVFLLADNYEVFNGVRIYSIREYATPWRWLTILFALAQCHKEAIEQSAISLKDDEVDEFAECLADAFFHTSDQENPVFGHLAQHYDNDFRQGFNHFARYLLSHWVKAKTKEDKQEVAKDWFIASDVLKYQPDSVYKQNKLPSFYRGASNDNLIMNPLLERQSLEEFVIQIPANKKYEASAIRFNLDVRNNPTLNNFDMLVYCAVRQICESNDPIKDSFGLSQYVIKIAEIVCTIFGVRPDNVMPDDARYEAVMESVEKLINFKMSFDARHFFKTRGMSGMSKVKEAQFIVGNVGVSRFTDSDNARDHETLFIYKLHRFFDLYEALGWTNTIPYCKTIFPQNIRSKDVIFLVTSMLSRAAVRGKASDTVKLVPLYEVNDLRTTDGAFSLFKDMSPFGWVDISVLGRGEATKEQRNKDVAQRRKVGKVLDHWRRSGIFEGIKTNQKTDKDKLIWYEAKLNLDALHKHLAA